MANRAEFISAIGQAALKYCDKYGIKVVSPCIAQACLESAYGTSIKAQYHNYFGLKYRANRLTCDDGYFVDNGTEQNQDGSWTPITTKWFKFASLDKGVEGYFQFLNNDNYKNLKGVTDPYQYLLNIKADGYATTLKYVDEVYKVIQSNDLTRWDKSIGAYDQMVDTMGYGRVLQYQRPLLKGADVTKLQRKLIALGFNCGKSGADGYFGKDTEQAVRAFQQKYMVNGIVNQDTWDKIFSAK